MKCAEVTETPSFKSSLLRLVMGVSRCAAVILGKAVIRTAMASGREMYLWSLRHRRRLL